MPAPRACQRHLRHHPLPRGSVQQLHELHRYRHRPDACVIIKAAGCVGVLGGDEQGGGLGGREISGHSCSPSQAFAPKEYLIVKGEKRFLDQVCSFLQFAVFLMVVQYNDSVNFSSGFLLFYIMFKQTGFILPTLMLSLSFMCSAQNGAFSS